MSEDAQADGITAFGPLPAVREAVRELTSALERTGALTGGDPLLEGDKGEFLRRWEDLCEQAGDGEPLVVHFAGHGVQASRTGNLYLATAGGEARGRRLVDTCVSFAQLLDEAENDDRPVLFLLDVCEAGQAILWQQLTDLAAHRQQDTPRNVWIIGACASSAITYGARFTTATAEILHQLADGDLDITPTLEYLSVQDLAAAVDRQLARSDLASGRPRQALMRTPHVTADPGPQPFFPNPAYTTDPQASLLSGVDPRLREFALGCAPGLDPLHFATRAAGTPTASDILFCGRRSPLDRIQAWSNTTGPGRDRLLVVTGSEGSGKSALLGITVCLLHPDLESLGDRIARTVEHFTPRQPQTVLAVHARQLTLQQITDSLRRQLNDQQHTTGPHRATTSASSAKPVSPDASEQADAAELLRELRTSGDVLMVLDALDEAGDPAAVLEKLLLPLVATDASTDGSGCHVMIGTRKWWDTLPALRHHLNQHPGAEIDLDPATDHDRQVLSDDLDAYLRKLLPRRRYPRDTVRHIADRIARYTDHGAFLVASLYAHHLLTTPEQAPTSPPRTITEVFDLHIESLTANDPWLRTVLDVLGQARGQGMPLDLIHTAALDFHRHGSHQTAPSLTSTRRALTKAAFYLRTTPDTDHRTLYRYFHQALTDHTASRTDSSAVHRALLGTIPTTENGAPDWARAHPYLQRHAADHAVASGDGALDQLLTDPRYLLHADPDTLAPHLLRARTDEGLLRADIYRTTVTYDPRRHRAQVRRDLLALDAAAWQQTSLARTITHTPLAGQPIPPTPVWATRRTHHARRHTLTGHTGEVHAIAVIADQKGVPLAVTGDDDGTVLVWDLAAGVRRSTLTGHIGRVRAIAVIAGPTGVPLAVTGGEDGTVLVWDLAAGVRRHTLTRHTSSLLSVATVTGPDGIPLAVTGGGDAVVVWDVSAGVRRHTLTGPGDRGLGVADLHGAPLGLSDSCYVSATSGRNDTLLRVATVAGPDHTPLAITSSFDGTVIVWDLATGVRRHTLTNHTGNVSALAVVTDPDGTPLAITAGYNEAIVWDAAAGVRRHTLTGHTGEVHEVATVTGPDSAPLTVTADDDPVEVWELGSARIRWHTSTERTGTLHAIAAAAGPDSTPLAITSDHDGNLIIWDVAAGTRRHTLTCPGEVHAVAVITDPYHIPLAVTGGNDGTVTVWDLKTEAHRHTLTGHANRVLAVAVVADPKGVPLAVTGGMDRSVMVWDVAAGVRRHTLTGPTDSVRAVAAVTDPDGVPLAITGGNRGSVMVWDLAAGVRRHTLTGHTNRVSAVAAVTDPDGVPLAITADYNGTVIVWDLAAGARRHTLTGHTGSLHAVAPVAGQNGALLAITSGNDHDVLVWDVAAGVRRYTLTGHTRRVLTVAAMADADGVPLAVTGGTDRFALVWDLTTGLRRHTLTGHAGPLHAVTLVAGPDGAPLAITGDYHGSVLVWDVKAGVHRHTLTGHTDRILTVAAVAGPDGAPLAVTADYSGTVIVWDPDKGKEVHRCHLPYGVWRVAAAGAGFIVAYGAEVAYFELPRSRSAGDVGRV
ncbi:AAA family ATPase [Streptomyces sp. NPDC093510]|uniref:AAA family ATPase n=1 Tax=Streptomyces sp. NPDC093510 TaxID=3155199 RepID=UPI00342BAE6F